MSVDANAIQATKRMSLAQKLALTQSLRKTAPANRNGVVLREVPQAPEDLELISQRFFLDGDLQEACGYQDVVLDERPLYSPELDFGSFDRIPRKRTSQVAVAALFVAMGVGAWTMAGKLPNRGSLESFVASVTGSSVGSRSAAAVSPIAPPMAATAAPVVEQGIAAAPVGTEAAVVAPTDTAPVEPVGAETARLDTQTAEPSVAAPAVATAPVTTTKQTDRSIAAVSGLTVPKMVPGKLFASGAAKVSTPAARTIHPVRPARATTTAESAEAPAINEPESNTSVGTDRPIPLRGYVWSPGANALVPAQTSGSTPAPTAEPSRAPAGRGIAPADTGPAPSESRTPSETVPILD